jgi:hypothetical protein
MKVLGYFLLASAPADLPEQTDPQNRCARHRDSRVLSAGWYFSPQTSQTLDSVSFQ